MDTQHSCTDLLHGFLGGFLGALMSTMLVFGLGLAYRSWRTRREEEESVDADFAEALYGSYEGAPVLSDAEMALLRKRIIASVMEQDRQDKQATQRTCEKADTDEASKETALSSTPPSTEGFWERRLVQLAQEVDLFVQARDRDNEKDNGDERATPAPPAERDQYVKMIANARWAALRVRDFYRKHEMC